MDESAADDEALYRLWRFLERRRRAGFPDPDLEDLDQLRAVLTELEATL